MAIPSVTAAGAAKAAGRVVGRGGDSSFAGGSNGGVAAATVRVKNHSRERMIPSQVQFASGRCCGNWVDSFVNILIAPVGKDRCVTAQPDVPNVPYACYLVTLHLLYRVSLSSGLSYPS